MMDIGFSNGAIANLCAIAMLGLAMLGFLRKLRRENEADTRAVAERIEAQQQKRHEENRDLLNDIRVSLGERVSKLERDATEFMARREIEGKIEHERGNRVALGEGVARQFERMATDVTDLKVRLGGLAQRQDGHDQQMVEIKALVREGFDKVEDKLDRLAGREGRA